LTEPDDADMQAIADLAAAGVLRPEIAQVLPLADAAEAHRVGETRRTAGRIVLHTPARPS
jgi:NADPH:quinone reductase-like Zn-dependent oxidoreductase